MASKRKLPQHVTNLKDQKALPHLSKVEEKVLGKDQEYPKPYIVLKFYQPSYQCFSDWTAEELRGFSALIHKMRKTDWSELTSKGALGYSIHKYGNVLPKEDVKCLAASISPEITFFELKVTGKARVHGFRAGAAFYLVWLDRNHDIYPS